MSATQVIAEIAIAESLKNAGYYGTYESDAADIVVALKAARLAIVDLPKQQIIPTGWGDDCLGSWPAGGPLGSPVSAWPSGVAMPGGEFIAVTEARLLAAALLAAADAVEAAS